jgi:ribosomal-protein-alanine N-acetyltransferase
MTDTRILFGGFHLRDAREDDAFGLFELSRDQEAMRYYGELGGAFADVEEAREEIEWFLSLPANNAYRWVIADDQRDEYSGDIGFFDADVGHRRAEIGFKLRSDRWNRGIVSGFMEPVLRYGFDRLGYNRVQAFVETGNRGSIRVLEKSGFRIEGVLRAYEHARGAPVDMAVLALLRHDPPR